MFKLALKNLLFYRSRSITTFVLTFVSTLFFIVYVAMMDGSHESMLKNALKVYTGAIEIYKKEYRDIGGNEYLYFAVPNSGVFRLSLTELTVESEKIPQQFILHQNYPNPFNPITTIQYELLQRSDVQINIYDLLGRKVITLVSEKQNAGFKSITWDATSVSSGMYFYQIRVYDPDEIGAGEYVQTRKMVVLK